MIISAAISPPQADDGRTDRRTLMRPAGDGLLSRARAAVFRRIRQYGYESRLYDWRLKGRHPLRLLGTPGDVWPGNDEAGTHLLNGTLRHNGAQLEIEDPDFWGRAAALSALRPYALSFSWLRDLAGTEDSRAGRAVAEVLTRGWLNRFSRYHAIAWAPAETGRRLSMWLLHAPLILSSNDLVYRSAILNAMARQARHLMRVARDAPSGPPLVDAAMGLVLCGLLLPDGHGWRLRGEQLLARALDRFILPDGGVLSRRSPDLIAIMQKLITIRTAYIDRMEEPPYFIQHALDRMAPMLRTLRHRNGQLAHLNGAGRETDGLLDLILDLSNADGKALSNAPYSGLMRLDAKRTTLLFDAMPPAPPEISTDAHAGTLAFELADDKDRLVVNIGAGHGPLAALSRTTAAHSTLVLGDRNVTEIHDDRLGDGVRTIIVERNETKDGTSINATHDGYRRRLRCDHRRRLHLSRAGDRLDGLDEILINGRLPKAGINYDLRFHLHPNVTASTTHGGAGVLLRLSSHHGWLFRVEGGTATLEDSLYLDRGAVRKTQQILVHGRVENATATKIVWCFERLGGKQPVKDETPKAQATIIAPASPEQTPPAPR